jgi:mortality factor 4-like protein 1
MQPKFSVEEKVLCYHGPLLYEAKILKMKKDAGVFTYFVHYQVPQSSSYGIYLP